MEMKTRVIIKDFAHLVHSPNAIFGHLLNEYDEHGRIETEGIVSFAIAAGPGSPIRGTDLFNEMINYFGNAANVIEGAWYKGTSGAVSTNIDKVNELTANGMPLEEAILHAWTVTRARKRGFDKVRVIGVPVGQSGSYTKIDVWIEK